MSMEDIIKVQIYVLKVNIHCEGCEKKVRKILRNIDGVCQTKVDAAEGKVTVSSLVDVDTIIKKLNKGGKPATLWAAKPELVSQPQNPELCGGDKGQPKDSDSRGQPNDVVNKVLNGGSSSDTNDASGVGGTDTSDVKDAQMATPQQLQQLQQLQMQMKGVKLPPQFTSGGKMPSFLTAGTTSATSAATKEPVSVKFNIPEDEFDDEGSELDDFEEDEEFDGLHKNLYNEPKTMMKPMAMPRAGGSKNCGMGGVSNGGKMAGGGANGISMQIGGMLNNGGGGKKDVGGKQNQGGGSSQGNFEGGNGKALQNAKGNSGAKGGGNQVAMQRKMFGGGPTQQGGTMKPPNMMGSAGLPGGMGQMGSSGPMGAGLPGGMCQMGPGGPRGAGLPGGMGQIGLGGPKGAGLPAGMGQIGPSGPTGNMPMAQHPHMSGMQPPSVNGMPNGGMPGAAFYQGSGGGGLPSGPQMMMQTAGNAGNPMAQHQQYMAMQQQQQMMMNGGHHGHHGGHGAAAGYPPPCYGYGRPPMHYPTYPEPYNIFSDENPNSSCSVM